MRSVAPSVSVSFVKKHPKSLLVFPRAGAQPFLLFFILQEVFPMFEEFMSAYGIPLIGAILTAVIGFLGIVAKNMAQRYLNTKEKRKVAKNVVLFVEQVYKSASGEEKLNQALTAAAEMLAERGIAFNELEMRVLIESALAQFNKVFGDALDDEDEEEV